MIEKTIGPSGVVLSEPAKLPNMSPSALSTLTQCRRKWWLSKVARIPTPSTPSLTTGIHVHNVLEAHLKGEELPEYTPRIHGIAAAGFHLLPSGDDVLVEQWVGRKEHPMDCGGLAYKGKIDLFDPLGTGAPKAGPKGLIWIGDHKTSSDPSKWGLRSDELATNHQALSYAYGIVISRGIEPPERIALSHFYYRTRGLPLGSRVDAFDVPWENVEKTWEHFESSGREMKSLAAAVDSARIPPNPNACTAYNSLCPFADICTDSPTAKKKRRLTTVLTKDTAAMSTTDPASKSPSEVAAWLLDEDATAPPEPRADAGKNPALSGHDGGVNPPDAAPELNTTKALMNEVAAHARNTLGILKGSMPEASFERIFTRNGLPYNDGNRAYVLSKIPAHIEAGDVREGAGAALSIAPEPKPEPRPKDEIDTTNADTAAAAGDVLTKIDNSALSDEHKAAISALYRATFTAPLGRLDEKEAQAAAKEAAGWGRFTKKRWAALIKDAALIGAWELDPGGAVVRLDDGGSGDGNAAGSRGDAVAAPVSEGSGDPSGTTPPAELGKPTAPELPSDPAPRFKEGLEEHTDGEPRDAMPYKAGSQKAADWFAGWDYGAAQAAFVVALAEWELAESNRIAAAEEEKRARIAAEEAATNKALSAEHTNANPNAEPEPKSYPGARVYPPPTGLTLYVDCVSSMRTMLSLAEYLAPFERRIAERHGIPYVYAMDYRNGPKAVASELVAHLAKTDPDFGALFVSSSHPAFSEVMAVLECVPGVEVVRAVSR